MFASGIPTVEKPQARRFYLMSHGPKANDPNGDAWRHYKGYLHRTSILIPFPPFLYRHLPQFIKSTIFLDFPIYKFNETTDGAAAIKEEEGKI